MASRRQGARRRSPPGGCESQESAAVGGGRRIDCDTGISGTDQAVAYAVFALIGTIGVGAPVVIYFGMGDRSGPLLDRLKTWMAANNAVIMVVLLLVIGAKLIGDAISGISS